MLKDLIELVSNGTISSKQGKEVLYKSLEEEKEPKKIVEESNMKQIGTEDEILKVVLEVISEHPESIEQYKAGRTNIVDFLVGQVMKKTRGQANPAITMNLILAEMGK